MLSLTVNDQKIVSNLSDWSLRFVEGNESRPVLYYLGKRVTQGWSIELRYDSAPEKDNNSNTADLPEKYIYDVVDTMGNLLDTFETSTEAGAFCLGRLDTVGIVKREIGTSMDWTR